MRPVQPVFFLIFSPTARRKSWQTGMVTGPACGDCLLNAMKSMIAKFARLKQGKADHRLCISGFHCTLSLPPYFV